MVRVRFPAFVFENPASGSGGWVVVERNVEDGATVGGLLAELVATHPGFREAVYNPASGVVSEQIGVVLNGQLLSFSEISETRLSNGDDILVQPIYSGG
jgi:molybdopterin converting factor small subunit